LDINWLCSAVPDEPACALGAVCQPQSYFVDTYEVVFDACDESCRLFGNCGNGIVEPGEQCDDGNLDNTDECLDTCLSASCGDNWVQSGEQCDDGNTRDGDACDHVCQAAIPCPNPATKVTDLGDGTIEVRPMDLAPSDSRYGKCDSINIQYALDMANPGDKVLLSRGELAGEYVFDRFLGPTTQQNLEFRTEGVRLTGEVGPGDADDVMPDAKTYPKPLVTLTAATPLVMVDAWQDIHEGGYDGHIALGAKDITVENLRIRWFNVVSTGWLNPHHAGWTFNNNRFVGVGNPFFLLQSHESVYGDGSEAPTKSYFINNRFAGAVGPHFMGSETVVTNNYLKYYNIFMPIGTWSESLYNTVISGNHIDCEGAENGYMTGVTSIQPHTGRVIDGLTITDNTFQNCAWGVLMGLDFQLDAPVTNILIADNIFRDIRGVQLQLRGDSQHGTIIRNTFENTLDAAVKLTGRTHDILVKNNTIVNDASTDGGEPSFAGLVLENAEHITAQGNAMAGTFGYPFFLEGRSRHNTFHGNNLSGADLYHANRLYKPKCWIADDYQEDTHYEPFFDHVGLGEAMEFDGSATHVEVDHTPDLSFDSQKISAAAWIHPEAGGDDWLTIISKFSPDGPNGYGELYFVLLNDQVRVRLAGATVGQWVPTTVDFGVWTHLAFTYDGDTLKLVKNGGEEVHELAGLGGTLALPEVTDPLFIGMNTWWPNEKFKGLMDEVHLFDRALSMSEIQQLYTQPGAIGDEVLYYSFDEAYVAGVCGDPLTILDQSSHHHNGTAACTECPYVDPEVPPDENPYRENDSATIYLGPEAIDNTLRGYSGGTVIDMPGDEGLHMDVFTFDEWLDLTYLFPLPGYALDDDLRPVLSEPLTFDVSAGPFLVFNYQTGRVEDVHLPKTYRWDSGGEVFYPGTNDTKPYAVFSWECCWAPIQVARRDEDPSSPTYGYWIPGRWDAAHEHWIPNGDPPFTPYASKNNFITGFERMAGGGGIGSGGDEKPDALVSDKGSAILE
jgi:cysteine-rich repeat protein